MAKIAERAEIVEPDDLASLNEDVENAIQRARDGLIRLQHREGHWCFELEADCTIPAEYILMMHYMDEVDADLQAKIATYLRAHQESHGSFGHSRHTSRCFHLSNQAFAASMDGWVLQNPH